MSAETAAISLADHFRLDLPVTLARRERYILPANRVEWSELLVVPYQAGALTVFPAVEVVVVSDTVTGYARADDGQIWDYVTYTFRIFGTVHGADFELTDRARKRLVAALKESLQSSGRPGELDRQVKTSYSQVGADRDKRTLAAAFVEVQMSMLELPVLPDPDAPDVPPIEHVVVTAEPINP